MSKGAAYQPVRLSLRSSAAHQPEHLGGRSHRDETQSRAKVRAIEDGKTAPILGKAD